MIQKFTVLSLICLSFVFSSCYTITHPDPCPGLVEGQLDSEDEICVDFNN